MKALPKDLRHERSLVAGAQATADAIGNPGVAVVSTPAMIGFLEHTCHLCIAAYFDDGEVSVGTHVNVAHHRAASAHEALFLCATVLERQGRAVTFTVEAQQKGKTVMSGTHARRVVMRERFLANLDPELASQPLAREPRTIDFWFDFNSPWCYLASLRIGDIARRHGATLRWRALHLANLVDAIDGRRVLEENAAFVRWYRADLMSWARRQGVLIRYHPQFPLRPSRALRASIYADSAGRGEAFVCALMRAYWTDNSDISDPQVLARLAERVGLDAGDVSAAASDAVLKDALNANLREAVTAGVFGLPSCVVGANLYFGNDRLEFLDEDLACGS